MSAPQVGLLLAGPVVLHGALVGRWPRYWLVLEDGSVAVVRRRAVLAIVNAPAMPEQTRKEPDR